MRGRSIPELIWLESVARSEWAKTKPNRKTFTAAAGVDFTGATIDGIVNCQGGQFKRANQSPTALSLNGTKIKGSVFLGAGFAADGTVDLRGSIVGENWTVAEARSKAEGAILDRITTALLSMRRAVK